MRFVVLPFLLTLLALSHCQYTATVTPSYDTAHNALLQVNCSSNTSQVYAAVYPGNHQPTQAAADIAKLVNVNVTVNSTGGVFYLGAWAADNTTQNFTLKQLTVDLLSNSNQTYTVVAYCNATTANSSNATYSSAASASWIQPDNNGTDYIIDVTYNVTLNDTKLTDLQAAQATALKALFPLQPAQVRVVSSTASSSVVRTWYLRNYTLAVDNSYVTVANLNSTLNLTALTNSLKASGFPYTATNYTVTSEGHPTVSLTLQTTTNATVQLLVGSGVQGNYTVVGILASQYNETYLSNTDVLAGTNENGTVFPFKKTGAINSTANAASAVLIDSLASNTTYKFFAVVQDLTVPTQSLTPQYVTLLATTAVTVVPNTTNSTVYTANVTVSVDAAHTVTINILCTANSTIAGYYAKLGNHVQNLSSSYVLNCAGTGNETVLVDDNRTKVCGRQPVASGNTNFVFTLNSTFFRNLGNSYSYAAYCQNDTATTNATVGSFYVPDNNGKNYQLTLTYNSSLNASTFLSNQSAALGSLLPNVPSQFIQSVASVSAFARALVNASNTTITTNVLRNYLVANDTAGNDVTVLFSNTTVLLASLNKIYNNSNITAVGAAFVALSNPSVTVAVASNTTTSSGVSLNLNSTVVGKYVVCAVPTSTYSNASHLNPDDVFNTHDENSNVWTINQSGSTTANQLIKVNFTGLQSNTTYNFFAVVQDSFSTLSPIANATTTTTGGSGSFGERGLAVGFTLVLALIAILLN